MITRDDLRGVRRHSQVPAELVGAWKPISLTNKLGLHIQASGQCAVYLPPVPYTVAQDVMTLPGQYYERLGASNIDLVGVWRERTLIEEMTLRNDMSYGYYVPPQGTEPAENYHGFYRLQTNPNKLQIFEVRSYVSEAAGQLVFAPVWGGNPVTFDYILVGNQLTLTHVILGDVRIFEHDGP